MTPEQFKRKRIDLGFSKKRMAELLNMSVRSVERYEAGKHKVSNQVQVILQLNDAIAILRKQLMGIEGHD